MSIVYQTQCKLCDKSVNVNNWNSNLKRIDIESDNKEACEKVIKRVREVEVMADDNRKNNFVYIGETARSAFKHRKEHQ